MTVPHVNGAPLQAVLLPMSGCLVQVAGIAGAGDASSDAAAQEHHDASR